MGLLNLDLNNVSLVDDNFDDGDPKILFMVGTLQLPPEQLCVGQFPPRTIARRQLPPGSYPPDDCPRHNYPRTIGNWQLSRGGIALEPFMLDLWLSVSNTSYVKKR